MLRECRPPARAPRRSWLARRSTMATSTPTNANSPASISPVGPAPTIKTATSRIVIKRLPSFTMVDFSPPRVPIDEMSTRALLTGFHKAANRGFAILELLWFGPTSRLEDRSVKPIVSSHERCPFAPPPALAEEAHVGVGAPLGDCRLVRRLIH